MHFIIKAMCSPSSPNRFLPSTESVPRSRLSSVWIYRETFLKKQCPWKRIVARHCVFMIKKNSRVERGFLKSTLDSSTLFLTDFGVVQENVQVEERESKVWVRRGECYGDNTVPSISFYVCVAIFFICKWKWLPGFLLHTGSEKFQYQAL